MILFVFIKDIASVAEKGKKDKDAFNNAVSEGTKALSSKNYAEALKSFKAEKEILSETPKILATLKAASALETLWLPGIFNSGISRPCDLNE